MTMMRFGKIALVACAALTLTGCVAPRSTLMVAPDIPSIAISAPPEVVRGVIIDSARQRVTAIGQVGDGLILERPLDATNRDVVAACGPHERGRNVRVVLRVRGGMSGTLLSEERYIADGPTVCLLPHTAEDRQQAFGALGRIRAQAEGRRV
jgi:hypothetical protein